MSSPAQKCSTPLQFLRDLPKRQEIEETERVTMEVKRAGRPVDVAKQRISLLLPIGLAEKVRVDAAKRRQKLVARIEEILEGHYGNH